MGRVKGNAAPAAEVGGNAVSDLNKNIRDTEADAKEALRKADGNESLSDKAANLGDRASNAVKDVGDKLHEGADDLSRDAAYEEGRQDEAMRPR